MFLQLDSQVLILLNASWVLVLQLSSWVLFLPLVSQVLFLQLSSSVLFQQFVSLVLCFLIFCPSSYLYNLFPRYRFSHTIPRFCLYNLNILFLLQLGFPGPVSTNCFSGSCFFNLFPQQTFSWSCFYNLLATCCLDPVSTTCFQLAAQILSLQLVSWFLFMLLVLWVLFL